MPSRTGVDIAPDCVAELSYNPKIIGCKDATGDLSRIPEMKLLCSDGFLLYSGDDETAKDFLVLGGDGVISVVNNVVPGLFKEMCDAVRERDKQTFISVDKKLQPLYKALFLESNPVPVKWALKNLNHIQCDAVRLPLTSLKRSNHEKVLTALKHAEVQPKQEYAL